MVARAGSLATIDCEPRQARKGATVAVDSGAEVLLVRAAAIQGFNLRASQYVRHHLLTISLVEYLKKIAIGVCRQCD